MALRAVIFDFGRVLSGPPEAAAQARMEELTGLSSERFKEFYWADRQAYDEGKFSGIGLWEKFLSDAGLRPNPALVAELNGLDARMWTQSDEQVLAWQQQLKSAGLLTAILSNMGDAVEEKIVLELDWIERFDTCVWSHRLGFAKPDRRIYAHTLDLLGVPANESLFIDDKQENIDAAVEIGMQAVLFTTMTELCKQLIARGLDRELPMPMLP